MNELMRRGGVLTLLRGPFKRKSTPQPTTPTTVRNRTPRFAKMQQRSQSMGSLSVNTSPAKYEPITNPLRMAASMEANNTHGLHDIDVDSIVVFERGTGEVLPKLRRTQDFMLCVIEEPLLSINYPPSKANQAFCPILDKESFTNSNNNNNIYTDLELFEENVGIATGALQDFAVEDVESVTSGDVTPPTPKLSSEELFRRRQINVTIEINREDSMSEQKSKPRKIRTNSEEKIAPLAVTDSKVHRKEPTKSSIDAHLDKIDELNRNLDDRLKHTMQYSPNITNGTNFHVIESSNTSLISCSKLNEDLQNAASKRISSNSSCECRINPNRAKAAIGNNNSSNGKKRSMSFSHKSINTILTNIKEFSKSRIQKSQQQSSHLTEDCEISSVLDGVAELSIDTKQVSCDLNILRPKSTTSHTRPITDTTINSPIKASNTSNNTITTANTTHTTIRRTSATYPSKEALSSTHAIMSTKLKFKVPKIQKKSRAIRNTFRSKLMNFQIKRGKFCKMCTKRRRIHPNKNVFDFNKELNIMAISDEDFCVCPTEMHSKTIVSSGTNTDQHLFEFTNSSADAENEESSEDVLSIQDHCYCVPSFSTSVSSEDMHEQKKNPQSTQLTYVHM